MGITSVFEIRCFYSHFADRFHFRKVKVVSSRYNAQGVVDTFPGFLISGCRFAEVDELLGIISDFNQDGMDNFFPTGDGIDSRLLAAKSFELGHSSWPVQGFFGSQAVSL